MPKELPEYLKLHREELPAAAPLALAELNSVDLLCRAFQRATGWTLQYEPPTSATHAALENGAGLILTPAWRGDEDPRPRAARQDVEPLAAALAIVLGELDRTRQTLWRREAELAAGMPVMRRDDEEQHLAQRLEAALDAGARAVGCQAAALYLLDEGTSELKLRACVGLSSLKLMDPPRPLRGALADLEALLGHAVVIEDTALLPQWKCPEDFPSAVCVPVSSPTTPLGTLWIFSEKPRDFTPEQTNVVEIVAGRIASDLEREMLLTATQATQSLEREVATAVRWQAERLPAIAPLVDDWDIAGLSLGGERLTSEFYDWSVLPDGRLALALGDAHGQTLAAGLSAAALHAAVKAHANYRHDAGQLVERVNETLWTSSPGGESASLFYGLLCPAAGELTYANAGNTSAVLVHPDGYTLLTRPAPPLGRDLDLLTETRHHLTPPGGTIVMVSDGVLASCDARGLPWDEAAIAEFVSRLLSLSAAEIAARLMNVMNVSDVTDRTILVAKRVR